MEANGFEILGEVSNKLFFLFTFYVALPPDISPSPLFFVKPIKELLLNYSVGLGLLKTVVFVTN